MNYSALWRQSVWQLLRNWQRSCLAWFSIWVGVTSMVTLLICSDLGSKAAILPFKHMEKVIRVIFFNQPGEHGASIIDQNIQAWDRQLNVKQSTIRIRYLYGASVYFKHNALSANVILASSGLFQLFRDSLASGRFFFPSEQQYFCLVGSQVNASLVSDIKAVNQAQWLDVNGSGYRKLGVLRDIDSGLFMGAELNHSVIINWPNWQTDQPVDEWIIPIEHQQDFAKMLIKVQSLLPKKPFHLIRSSEDLIKKVNDQRHVLMQLLMTVGGLTLCVGGLGVMNVMWVSVIERTSEIGLRRAIGSSKKNIAVLFLFDALCLTMTAGIFGSISAQVIAYGLTRYLGWPFAWMWLPMMLGFVVAMAMGIIFGAYPAYQAAKLDPIEALNRHAI
ncbi:FtsX-like permease family protein [Gammaproteobacteria bacterium]|nr:FtsX-like permease family protein [Gammaproteobacteria bacterium]